MAERKIRYMVDGQGTAFSIHGEGLTIQAVTRKSEVPVTLEIEGVSRKLLLQFKAAIDDELARREEHWRQERQRLVAREPEPAVMIPTVEEKPAA